VATSAHELALDAVEHLGIGRLVEHDLAPELRAADAAMYYI